MKIIVLWSGDCDSTLILNNLAKNSSKQNPIYALTVINNQVKQQNMEKIVRKNYLEYAKSKSYHIKNIEIIYECRGGFNYGDGLVQPLLWVCGILPFLSDGDELNFGYIKDDCFWHYKELFIDGIASLLKLKHTGIDVKFPLEWKSKSHVIRKLKRQKIYKYTWYCEEPKDGKSCGVCTKCISVKLADYKIRLERISKQ